MPAAELLDIEIRLLLEAIFLRYGSDFRNYSPASVRRRITFALEKMRCRNVSELQTAILYSEKSYEQLLQLLTVPTTEMFRDPAFFMALRTHVFPHLQTYPSIRIWIAGCSTGEELYSTAILLDEEGLLDKSFLYATDVNPISLKRAEEGIFPLDQIKQYTLNYQKSGGKRAFSDYYQAAYGSALFSQHLKRSVTFADHSLSTDTVFAEVELILCRNVMIYFNKDLQERSIKLFHDSLGNRGFFAVGSKETLRFSKHHHLFEEFFLDERIYRKRGQG